MQHTMRQLGLSAFLGIILSGMWLPPVRADSTGPQSLPIPAIPGVAALPGPLADPATPIDHMGTLLVTPDKGVTGAQVTISGSGLPANTKVTLTWSTATVTWVLDPQPMTVDYRGRAATPLTVVLNKVTTDGSGAFSLALKAPQDWGGIHDIYAVVGGKQIAHGGFLVQRSFSISPTSGPIGTPITITYRGLGSTLYESGASLLYDNKFAGQMASNWTRGTARVVIRASGPVGKHILQVGNSLGGMYLNVSQSPLPWTTSFATTFTVTRDNGPPKAYLDWPANVAPTLNQRTTLEATGNVAASKVHMTLQSTAASVNTSISLAASGLASNAPVKLQWSTVVGNRVNCKGMCWDIATVPLGQATPAAGSVSTAIKVPDGLGGWHVVQMIQDGKVAAQVPFFVKESIVGRGVSSLVVKQGHSFTVRLKGVGWTQVDNTRAVTYDNSYIGYGCGFNSQGYVIFHIRATGGLGTHLIDFYPLLYTLSPSYASVPYGMVPMLSYQRDLPGLALGYQLPAARMAITVVR
jgi:hypothetical protein